MRCNRCGNPLDPRENRCSVCGKAVAPPRKRPAPQKPSEPPIKLPQLDKFTYMYTQDTARGRRLQWLTIFAAVAAIVLMVLVYRSVGSLQKAIDVMNQDTTRQFQTLQQTVTAVPAAPTEAPTQAPTEASDHQESNVSLSRQQVNATLTQHRVKIGNYAHATMDLGEFQDDVSVWTYSDKSDKTMKTHVFWDLTESGNRVELRLEDTSDGNGNVSITQRWALSGDIFGNMTDPGYVWECRAEGDEWGDLPSEYVTDAGNGCDLNLNQEQITLLLGQHGEMELRCRLSLTHADGGSITIITDGLTISPAGIVVFANKPG